MQQACYYPNGTSGIDSGYTPCDASAEFSACCEATDICVSNGYCFQQSTAENAWNNRLARGLCTDPSWDSTSCPQFCKDVTSYSTNSVVLVIDAPVGQYCCGLSGSSGFNSTTGQCFQSTLSSPDRPYGTEPFTLNEGQVIYNRSNGATLPENMQKNTTIITPAAANGTCAEYSGNGSNIAKTTAGSAVPLGVLLLAASTAVLFLLKKVKRQERRLRELLPEPVGKSVHLLHPSGQLPHPQPIDAQRYETGIERSYEIDGIQRNEMPGSKVPESGSG
ncbi:hypothetical protein EV356DRAFT_571947 [Viridothelium virens]|uniref:Mid2 domain-containing protein n=1 Tax=Viridothelium virens TaxID=1048519 RepID=A0A6A6HNY4_VIRVR|nr:hypothetical protein EV356DRAFT_571947 [Viridothelium virens]